MIALYRVDESAETFLTPLLFPLQLFYHDPTRENNETTREDLPMTDDGCSRSGRESNGNRNSLGQSLLPSVAESSFDASSGRGIDAAADRKTRDRPREIAARLR